LSDALLKVLTSSLLLLAASSAGSLAGIDWGEYSPALIDEYACVVSRIGTFDEGSGRQLVLYQLWNTCSKPVELHCVFAANGRKLPAFDETIAADAQTRADAHSALVPAADQIVITVASRRCEFGFKGAK
jgi:hypothetical protein